MDQGIGFYAEKPDTLFLIPLVSSQGIAKSPEHKLGLVDFRTAQI
jgi:hypothetical protein